MTRTRRSFLHLGLALGSGLAAALIMPLPVWPGPSRPALRLLAGLARPDHARAIGASWLAGLPRRPPAAELAGQIEEALAASSRPGLRAALAEAVTADFAARRMVSVDGWRLARTEARLFALAALVAAGESA